MYKFGSRSLENLNECHPDLQSIAHELIKEMDVAVICGHRSKADQDKAYDMGKSRLRWPHSKHNSTPSHAMDIVPWPLDWNDIDRFKDMCERVEKIAKRLNIHVRLGRDFSFKDWNHIELV